VTAFYIYAVCYSQINLNWERDQHAGRIKPQEDFDPSTHSQWLGWQLWFLRLAIWQGQWSAVELGNYVRQEFNSDPSALADEITGAD
jgi:hypothetical protein